MKRNDHCFYGFRFVPNPYGDGRGWMLDGAPPWYTRLPLQLYRNLAHARAYAFMRHKAHEEGPGKVAP